MNTIIILAEALSKASGIDIDRLDIQYNSETEQYTGYLWLDKNEISFVICEDGNVKTK